MEDENAWSKGGYASTGLNNNISPAEEYTPQQYGQEEVSNPENPENYYQEPVLDPSGQWYWDYNQQQWFPYYQDPGTGVAGGPPPADQQAVETTEQIASGLGGLQLEQSYPEQTEPAPSLLQSQAAEEAPMDEAWNRPRQGSVMSTCSSKPETRDRQPSVDGSQYSQQYSGDPGLAQEQVYQPDPPPQQEHNEWNNAEPNHPNETPELAAMGPPDLVDHRPNTSQPEIVSDLSRPVFSSGSGLHQPHSVPPPDMFASLPASNVSHSPDLTPGAESLPDNLNIDLRAAHGSRPSPDIGASYHYGGRPDLGATPPMPPLPDLGSAPPMASGPDLGAAPPMALVPDLGAAPHIAYRPDLGAAPPMAPRPDFGAAPPLAPGPDLGAALPLGARPAPDLTAQSVIQNSSLHSTAETPPSSQSVSHDQHYDFYKGQFESAMPDITSGRSGVLPPPSSAQPLDGKGKAPDILRTEPLVPTCDRNLFMETGELREEEERGSYPTHPPPANLLQQISNKPGLPPMVGGNDPPSLSRMGGGIASTPMMRMVGGNDPPSMSRMVVGESTGHHQPPSTAGHRLVEGESQQFYGVPAPLPAREVEGEELQAPHSRTADGHDGSPAPLPPSVRTREVEGQLMDPSSRRVTGVPSPEPHTVDFSSSTPMTPIESSPTHHNSQTEARSEAAGSERRDETVMGGPPALKAPPLPTPGRAVAGQEYSVPFGARRRGDDHKKSTYDSDEDRNQESDSEREREKSYLHPRRTVSPGSRSTRSRPSRAYDRLNRSSTDRDEDSDRRNRGDYYRDKREDDRGYRRDYGRNDKGRYREQRRYRDEDEVSFREEDRRSVHGGSRRMKEEPYHSRYRDDPYYRRRVDSDYERDSHYGEDMMNR